MEISRSVRVAANNVLALAALSTALMAAQATTPSTIINALWVNSVASLPSPVTDAPTQAALIQNSSASGVNMLYLSVYSSTPDSAGRYLVQESSIASLVSSAHARGIQVYAAMGDPDWPSSGCAKSSTPYQRFADIAGFDSANPSARFDGIMLDVEPGSSPDFSALLSLYQCFQQQASASGLGLAAAINAFWTTSVTFNQVTEAAYQQIVDLKLNNLVVMGYRNSAGTLDCTQGDGMVCLDEDIIAYANTRSLGNMILVGLNTDNPATSGDSGDETFYSAGQAAMNSAAQAVISQFAAINQTFGGFATNNYRDSYLNGQLSGWPATNANLLALPQFSAAAITNSASFVAGGVAPGELISIFGQNLGPAMPQSLQLIHGTVTTSLAGVRVLVNGVPAPMVLAYSGQVNAIVPFEVQTSPTAAIQIAYAGVESAVVTVPVAPAVPGIFTADSSGTGAIAALNQNGSLNSSTSPAAAGSIVTLYLTGAGQTTPAGVDGLVAADPSSLPLPTLPVSARIGGLPATVYYAGNSVGIVSGAIQLNVMVPAGLSSGPQSVSVKVGSASSQAGVTIAVQ
jgi:uncharacterized protein (TIGR03437 family)